MGAVYLGGFFAYRSTFSQTPEISFVMPLLSNIAIFSAHSGFFYRIKLNLLKKILLVDLAD